MIPNIDNCIIDEENTVLKENAEEISKKVRDHNFLFFILYSYLMKITAISKFQILFFFI